MRAKGVVADFSYKGQAVGKQLKEANRRGARHVAILRPGAVGVKNLTTGQQAEIPLQDFLAEPGKYLV